MKKNSNDSDSSCSLAHPSGQVVDENADRGIMNCRVARYEPNSFIYCVIVRNQFGGFCANYAFPRRHPGVRE